MKIFSFKQKEWKTQQKFVFDIYSRKILKKNYAGLFQTNKGFTLLEIMMTIFIVTIISSFIVSVFPFIKLQFAETKTIDQMEWENLIHQIKIEIRESSEVKVVNGKLELTHHLGTIQYEKFDSILRRRVNKTGHEVLLYKVQSVNFQVSDQFVTISVFHENGQTYEKTIYFPNKIKITLKK